MFRRTPILRNALRALSLRRVRAWLGFGSSDVNAADEVVALPPDLIEPIVEPRFGIDGWTYRGTVLEEYFPPDVEAELAQAVHMICARLATAWNYRRAVRLLEEERAYSQAYAVLEAYSRSGLDLDAGFARWRSRLATAVLAQAGEAG